MASTSDAVIRPTPSGGAENQKKLSPIGGIHAKVSVSQGWTFSAMNGASTKKPHMP